MYDAPYEFGLAADGYPVRIRARGRAVLTNPMLNRGTAFTPEQRQMLGLQGLLLSVRDFQKPYARTAAEVVSWSRLGGPVTLADVVANAKPTMLIGTCTQSGAFTEDIVRQMASTMDRPVIMPLTNPVKQIHQAM
jgi:malic enzyme